MSILFSLFRLTFVSKSKFIHICTPIPVLNAYVPTGRAELVDLSADRQVRTKRRFV